MTLVIKKINEEKLREFKAEAIRRGLTFSEAFEEAIDLWLKNCRKDLGEKDLNNKVYEEVKNKLIKENFGKYVIVAKGKVLGVYDNLKDVIKTLKNMPTIKHAIVAKLGVDVPLKGELEWWGGSIKLENA